MRSSILSRFVWGYVFFIALWMLLRLMFFDRIWWLALVNFVALYLFVPLLIFLPMVVWFRSLKAFLGLCFPLGIFIALYSPFFVPQFPVAALQNQCPITAMTYLFIGVACAYKVKYCRVRYEKLTHTLRICKRKAQATPTKICRGNSIVKLVIQASYLGIDFANERTKDLSKNKLYKLNVI